MTSEDSTLREVDQDLAEERQMALIRRYGPVVAGIAIALIMGVAGWQIYTGQKSAAAEKGAKAYHAALFTLEDDPELAGAALTEVTQKQAPGYAALAAFRQAPILARDGDTAQAYRLYRAIVDDQGVTSPMRDLARLRSAYLSLDVGGRVAVMDDLGDLPTRETALGFYARELVALAALGDNDFDAAIQEFSYLADASQAPAILRSRASEFAVVARAGKAGANISGEARVEDLLESLGTPLSSAPSLGEDGLDAPTDIQVPGVDDGHGHGEEDHLDDPETIIDSIKEQAATDDDTPPANPLP